MISSTPNHSDPIPDKNAHPPAQLYHKRLGVIALFTLLFALIIAGCFKIPDKPKWDFPITIPFAERTYYLKDLIDLEVTNANDYRIDSVRSAHDHGFYSLNDSLVFYVTGNIEPKTFVDKLSSDAQDPRTFTYNISTIMLDSLFCGELSFKPSRMGILNRTIAANQSLAIDTMYKYDQSGGSNFVYFTYLLWGTGRMMAIVNNDMPTKMENIHFELLRYSDSTRLAVSDTIRTLAAGRDTIINMEVPSGTRIDSMMVLRGKGIIRAGSTPVTLTSRDSINVQLITNRIRVSETRAAVPRQVASADTSLETGINDRIYAAEVKRGKIFLTITNRLDVTLDSLKIVFRDFSQPRASQPTVYDTLVWKIPHSLPRLTSYSDSIDLQLSKIKISPDSVQRFKTYGLAYTHPVLAPNMASIRPTDGIDIRYNLGKTYFSNFDGIPYSVTFDFDSTTTTVTNRPNGVTNLGMESAYLVVSPRVTGDADSTIPVKMDYHLRAYAPNGRNAAWDTTNQYFPTLASSVRIPGVQGILNIVPERVVSTGKVYLGRQYIPSTGRMRVSENAAVSGHATLEGPMYFSLDPQTLIPDPEGREGQDRPLQQINLIVQSENHLPIGGTITVQISKDSTDTNGWRTIGSDIIPTPEISPTTHRAISPVSKTSTFIIRDSLVNYFKAPQFYTRAKLSLTGTRPLRTVAGTDSINPVTHDTVRTKIFGNVQDFIRIKTAATLVVNTGEVQ